MAKRSLISPWSEGQKRRALTDGGQASEFFSRDTLGVAAMLLLAVYGNSGKHRFLSLMALGGVQLQNSLCRWLYGTPERP
jgi:hypothetical protein